MDESLRLERFGRDLDATWGRLTCGLEMFFTAERAWRYNRRFQSCIPDGSYNLVSHDSDKYPRSWALVGPGVSHVEMPGIARYTCLLHVANWPWELEGCIAPGSSIRWMEDAQGRAGQAVADSGTTLRKIDEFLSGQNRPRIEIVSNWGT